MAEYILAVHCGHDASATLLCDDHIVAAIMQERLDRVKHSDAAGCIPAENSIPGFPGPAVRYCLEAAEIAEKDIALFTSNFDGPVPTLEERRIPYPKHHLCHAASAYYSSTFDRAAILVIDYAGDTVWLEDDCFVGYERESAWLGDDEGITPIWRRLGNTDATLFGIGCVFNQVAAYLFASPDAEGKLMALAAHGRPNQELGDPFFVTDANHVYVRPSRMFHQAERPPTLRADVPHYECELDWDALPPSPGQTGEFTQFHLDLASKLQRECEDAVLFLARNLQRVTGASNLVLGGGVALNCLANGRVARETGFRHVYLPPAPHDGGLSLGAALLAWHAHHKGHVDLRGGYTGRVYSEEEIATTLSAFACDIVFTRSDDPARDVARLLVEGRIVAWAQGGSELGPRALGGRSILADPRNVAIIQRLNRTVKRRHWFQPVAPSVRTEDCEDYFEPAESPFMSFAVPVKARALRDVPGIVHADGTARIHTVNRHTNALFHRLLCEFHALTNVPLVANTSFNRKGEPIVETPHDAVIDLLKMPLDALSIGPFIVTKRQEHK